jgi:hypothetical protein
MLSWPQGELTSFLESLTNFEFSLTGVKHWVDMALAFFDLLDSANSVAAALNPVSAASSEALVKFKQTISLITGDIAPIRFGVEQLNQITRVREHAERAAGEIADLEIAIFFERYAKQRRRSYQLWSVVIAACLAGAVAVSYESLRTSSGESVSHEISRWALLIPLLVFTGYAARQASRNRSIAEWSEIAQLRARSIDAFVQRLPGPEATQILHQFGSLVYAAEWQIQTAPVDSDAMEGLWSHVVNGGK